MTDSTINIHTPTWAARRAIARRSPLWATLGMGDRARDQGATIYDDTGAIEAFDADPLGGLFDFPEATNGN